MRGCVGVVADLVAMVGGIVYYIGTASDGGYVKVKSVVNSPDFHAPTVCHTLMKHAHEQHVVGCVYVSLEYGTTAIGHGGRVHVLLVHENKRQILMKILKKS